MSTLLVIDDKADNLVTASAVLKALIPDCTVVTALSGKEGLVQARLSLPDAILLDLKMPEMDGFEVCRRLKEDDLTRVIPIIILSAARTDLDSRVRSLELGADAFLSKPIVPIEMVAQVKAMLRIKRAEDQIRGENVHLEALVHERTLTLQKEIAERKHAEEEIRSLNSSLEERVAARTAELAALNRELESFSYSVSHDLRAPLRHLEGFSKALLEDYGDRIDGEGQTYLQMIQNASRRMKQLIDDLLNLSQMSLSKMHHESINLSEMCQSIITELQIEQPDRIVRCRIADNLLAKGDKRLLMVVLQNLVGNAWKYTSNKGEAVIEFGMAEQERGWSYYLRDNGAGFNMEYAGQLFAPFRRLHRNDEFEGNGIGLATVQRIIRRHGGDVWAEAEVDKGATFYFTLSDEGVRAST